MPTCMRVKKPVARFLFFVILLAWSHGPAEAVDSIDLERIISGLSAPLLVTHAGDGSNRLFVVEQGGRVLIFEGGRLLGPAFLDLSSEIGSGGEQGLLGLAFHPEFAENGFFFVNYTDRRGDTVVSRFSVSGDPNRADGGSEVEVLSFRQPFSNHNGGHLAFGPDNYLYIASGDGGGGGDPQNNGQDLGNLLGKILRIDVDGLPLAIPPSNPFVGRSGARDEIWVYGLRNPWRFSFDRDTGDIFIGDVGQSREEEIDFQPAASAGGENYGWKRKEGSLCFEPVSGCDDPSFSEPILVYGHGPHCSVTGGYRYRGRSNAALRGVYVFGDFCSGVIWGALPGSNGVWSAEILAQTRLSISSFGEDESGELYVVDRGGSLFRVGGSAVVADDFESGQFGSWKRARGNVAIVQPGLRGSDHALQVTVDGSGTRSMLVTTAPRSEKSLSVRFLFNANAVDLAGREVGIVELRGSGADLVRLELEPTGSRYRASLWVRQADGGDVMIGRTSVKRADSVLLGFEWRSATSAGSADGLARLIKGRKVRAERDDLATGSVVVQSVRIGLPDGSSGTVGGSLLFDDILISR